MAKALIEEGKTQKVLQRSEIGERNQRSITKSCADERDLSSERRRSFSRPSIGAFSPFFALFAGASSTRTAGTLFENALDGCFRHSCSACGCRRIALMVSEQV